MEFLISMLDLSLVIDWITMRFVYQWKKQSMKHHVQSKYDHSERKDLIRKRKMNEECYTLDIQSCSSRTNALSRVSIAAWNFSFSASKRWQSMELIFSYLVSFSSSCSEELVWSSTLSYNDDVFKVWKKNLSSLTIHFQKTSSCSFQKRNKFNIRCSFSNSIRYYKEHSFRYSRIWFFPYMR